MVTLSCMLFCVSSLVDASDNQRPFEQRSTHHNVSRNIKNNSDVDNSYSNTDYVHSVTNQSQDDYKKENTQRSKSAGSKADSNKGLRG